MIERWFGEGRFNMDLDQSHSRVVFAELLVRDGAPCGRLELSTVIVPASIRDGECSEASIRQGARAALWRTWPDKAGGEAGGAIAYAYRLRYGADHP